MLSLFTTPTYIVIVTHRNKTYTSDFTSRQGLKCKPVLSAFFYFPSANCSQAKIYVTPKLNTPTKDQYWELNPLERQVLGNFRFKR